MMELFPKEPCVVCENKDHAEHLIKDLKAMLDEPDVSVRVDLCRPHKTMIYGGYPTPEEEARMANKWVPF